MGSHEEIVMDILSRLPVKSLLRFKSVSKFWNKLISQPYFKKMHLNVHANSHNFPPKLLIGQIINFPPYTRSYVTGTGDRRVYLVSKTTFNFYSFSLSNSAPQLVKDMRRLDFPSNFKPKVGRVYCCCDGLCLIGIWSEFGNTPHPSTLLLWNPSTGESVKLPTQYPESPPEQYLYGLGYDPTIDDYKIIRIDAYEECEDGEGEPDEILAIKSASWRKTSEYAGGINGIQTRIRELCLAFVEGAFHWKGVNTYCVVSFNISNETYGKIPLPVTPYSNRVEETGVSAVGGRLCYHYDDKINFNLWVMKDYGMKESWTKWFSIPSLGEGVITPIYRFSNDEVLLSCYTLKADEEYIYETSNGSSNLKWPQDSNDIIASKTIVDGFVYTESLISPKLGTL